ncbi:nucleoside hydrolase [Eubacteriales bacterium OttesenSCG-928-A19]|nr:nucleoside hydrolase [Eubacteriales bacterium OttesenSCG-928-A19]
MTEKGMEPVRVVLDTDIGPDCDDAAALAMMHLYADRGYVRPLAVAHGTSMPWGVGAIRAINAWYGRPELAVGTLKDTDLLVDSPAYEKYNRPLSERVPEALRDAPDAVAVYREALAAQPDDSVVFVAIGPLRNLRLLLQSGPDAHSPLSGKALVAAKVRGLALMAGCFAPYDPETQPIKGAEWNIEMDIPSARHVAEHWPTEMVYCGFEVGYPVIVGGHMARDLPEDHPVRQAYACYGAEAGRNSWDLLTVQWAMDPCTANYTLSPEGTIAVDEAGVTQLTPHAKGRHRFLSLARPAADIAAELDMLLATK